MSWDRNKLGKYLVGEDIMLPDGAMVNIDFFESLFTDAIAAGGTYADFVASDYAVDENGNVICNRGYKAFLDQLKAEGVLS